MAGVEKVLSVRWFGQLKLYYCGPAVAQMFLDFFKVNVPQDDLWSDITNNSGGSRPPDAPSTDHDFPQQVCENCDGTNPPNWECWDTTPEALQKTLAARTSDVSVGARYPKTFDDGVGMLIESLDRSPAVPAFATTYLINHWVLVNGYLRDDSTEPTNPPETVGKYNLNGFYILDPLEKDPADRVRLVGVKGWRTQFGLIDCPTSPNGDKYPIVVGEDRKVAAWVLIVLIILLASVIVMLAMWLAGD